MTATTTDTARWLREKGDTWWRDAHRLRAMGNDLWPAYAQLGTELYTAARQLDGPEDPNDRSHRQLCQQLQAALDSSNAALTRVRNLCRGTYVGEHPDLWENFARGVLVQLDGEVVRS